MGKIHLLLKKEDIDQEKIKDKKIVVVFDVLLATSTITSALEFGAKEVIPVLNGKEAQKEVDGRNAGSYVLVGEYEGQTLDGFLSPNPLELREQISGKTVILSTTNGTVALKGSSPAKTVYAASLLNNQAVANHILHQLEDETLIIVCSGSSGEFNVEDFYGAGHFIDCILSDGSACLDLTDSAYAAHQFYHGNRKQGEKLLRESRVGRMLTGYGYEKEIEFVSQESLFSIIPILKGKTIVNAETEMWEPARKKPAAIE